MPTGYETSMYRDITLARKALESIAASLEKIANPPVAIQAPPDNTWATTAPIKEST